jgi:hypothetical protein
MVTHMRIPGERVKTTRLVRGGRFVVAVDVEMVIPPDDPSEPCYEAETVELVRAIAEHAERGDASWLQQHGLVYELIGSGRESASVGTG